MINTVNNCWYLTCEDRILICKITLIRGVRLQLNPQYVQCIRVVSVSYRDKKKGKTRQDNLSYKLSKRHTYILDRSQVQKQVIRCGGSNMECDGVIQALPDFRPVASYTFAT